MVVRVEHQYFGARLALAGVFALTALSLLLIRLWYLQGVYGSFFRDLSENNRIRTVQTKPARGVVYDLEGRELVGNRPAFNVSLILEDTPDLKKTLQDLARVTGRDPEALEKQLNLQKRGRHHFERKVVMPDVSREELAKTKVNNYWLPGVIVDVIPTRFYPYASMAAQIFGYSREISRGQLEQYPERNYRMGDVVGQSGLEKQYEDALRGQAGYRQVEVEAMGNRKGERGIVDDLPGRDLYLNIDLDLQRVAEENLAGKKGAVVVLDPNSGAVLTIASAPAFDPNMFAGQMRGEDWLQVAKDRLRPLSNRAIGQVYPVGSTFKLITSVAAIAEKKATMDTQFNCPGYFPFAGRKYMCHKKTGHGMLTLRRALAVSCNAYYFQLGQLLGIGLIEKYAKLLGLGHPTGIDLPGEEAGIVPSEQWKREKYGERWYPGDTLPVSIGQGYVVVTPIQMAVAISTIANGGTVWKPFLVRKIGNHLTGEVTDIAPTVVRKMNVDPKVFEQVREMAVGVVNDQGGTGKAARFDNILVGGKTGTAQVSALGREHLSEALKDHAWFVAFAPAEKPLIAMSVVIENGGHGGSASAPIAHKIMEVFFRKRGMLPPEVTESSSSSSSSSVRSGSTSSAPRLQRPVVSSAAAESSSGLESAPESGGAESAPAEEETLSD